MAYGEHPMSWRAGVALIAASAAYVALILTAAGKLGAYYEEVVPYVLSPLDIRSGDARDTTADRAPRFVASNWLPRLALEPTAGMRLPLLNQLYMTDHLSYGGVVLAATGMDRLWAARLWHAPFGILLLWLLYDVAVLLGLGRRVGLLSVAIAATSLQLTAMYTQARFDESLASFGTVAVLWAALHYSRDSRARWIWAGMLAAGISTTAKVTTLWPLAGLALAGGLAGWRPPPLRTLWLPALLIAPLFMPMLGFAISGPDTEGEVGRRLYFLTDLFTTNSIPASAANLIDYLGNWGSLVSLMIRGADAHAANQFGRLLICCTLIWLMARVARSGPPPRRYRLETQMLAFLGVVFIFVTLFFRERRDYQYVLLVPLHTLTVAAFLDWIGRRWLDRRVPAWGVAVLLAAPPIASNLWEQRAMHRDLVAASNAMLDLRVQRASAAWLSEHGVDRPIVTTFYAVGTYELLSDGIVRPVYAFPMLRQSKDRSQVPDPVGIWHTLLAEQPDAPQYVVLPVGENPIEAQHFDEPAIRAALLQVARSERVATFSNQRGDPLLEIWRVALRPPATAGATARTGREPDGRTAG
jgi:hypothetical protein